MKNKWIVYFYIFLIFGFVFTGCSSPTGGDDTGTTPGEDDESEMDYITIWQDPQEKQINVTEGTITVILLATGKYCDVYYDRNISRPSESQLKRIAFGFDNGYVKATSFLNLYENGGGPDGDGGRDNNPRIQTYIYDLYPAGGRYSPYNGESVYIDINNVEGSTFTHELCHLIFYGNHFVSPETWYHELLPIMSDYVFHGVIPDWNIPNVKLFGGWVSGGGSDSWPYYNTYRKLAKFLVDKYGDSILYDLYHTDTINKQALENILAEKGTTVSSAESEFADYCNNFGYPDANEVRIIMISNVTLTGTAGVWLTENLPSGDNLPTNTAIQSGTVNNTIVFSLVVPRDNTWNTGPAWLGTGDYYVYLVPVVNQAYQWNNALVYTGGGNTPVRVTFDKAITVLSFENFKEK
jgi:hypothetical protein